VRDFTSTFRKHELGIRLSRAAILIPYRRCFMDDHATRTTLGWCGHRLLPGTSISFRPGLIRSTEHPERIGQALQIVHET
jgi:hypothetical protein